MRKFTEMKWLCGAKSSMFSELGSLLEIVLKGVEMHRDICILKGFYELWLDMKVYGVFRSTPRWFFENIKCYQFTEEVSQLLCTIELVVSKSPEILYLFSSVFCCLFVHVCVTGIVKMEPILACLEPVNNYWRNLH